MSFVKTSVTIDLLAYRARQSPSVQGMVGWVGGSAGSGLGPFQPVKGGLGGHLSPDHARESNLSKVRFPCLMFSEQADAKHALQESGKMCWKKVSMCVGRMLHLNENWFSLQA